MKSWCTTRSDGAIQLSQVHSTPPPLHAGPALLQVRDLRTWFPIKRGVLQRTVGQIKAVDGVSFDVQAGRTVGLGGESGCGKATGGRAVLRVIPAMRGWGVV